MSVDGALTHGHASAAGAGSVLALFALIAATAAAVAVVQGGPMHLHRPTREGRLLGLGAAASLGAGVVHAAVAPAHLAHDTLHGAFFALLAVGQVVLAGYLLRAPGGRVLRVGLAVSVWVSLLWALTRTTGVVLVTAREPVGALDVGAALLQLVVAGICWRALTLQAGAASPDGVRAAPGRRADVATDDHEVVATTVIVRPWLP